MLAETLGEAGGDDGGGFGVELADLVAAVVVLGVCEVSVAPFGLAPRRVGRTGFQDSGPAVEPVHEVVLRGGEVGPTTQVQPNPAVVLHTGHRRFAFRDHHEPARFEGQHGGRRRRLVRRTGGASVEVGAEMGIGVVEGHVVVVGGEVGGGGDEIGGGVGEVVGGVRVKNGAVGLRVFFIFFLG